MAAGNAFILLGCGLLYTVGYERTVQPEIFGYEVFVGFGIGLIFSSATVLIRVQASERDGGKLTLVSPFPKSKLTLVTASAQGLMTQSRLLGGNIGLAIGTVVLNQHVSSGLSDTLSPEQVKNLQQSLNTIETFTPQEAQAVSVVFSDAFQSQVLISACMAAAGLVSGLFIWQRNPPSLNSKIAAEASAKARAMEKAGATSPDAAV